MMTPLGSLTEVSDLIRAVATLAWPALVIAALFLFREKLRELISRLVRARGPGGFEVEFERELDEVKARTELLKALPAGNVSAAGEADHEDVMDRGGAATAAKSPAAALIAISHELAVSMRRTLAALGHYPKAPPTMPFMARELVRLGVFQEEGVRLVEDFVRIRDQIVHGPDVPESDAVRAVDIGFDLLDTIDQLPREHHIVAAISPEVFADAEGKQSRHDVRAVILTSPTPGEDAAAKPRRAFPTTKTYFEPGQEVSWEWGLGNTYGESWYRDPDTDAIEYGWTSSAEFVGRPLEWL